MKAISSIVSGDQAAIDKAFGEGLYIGGERYVLTRVEGRSLYARSVRIPSPTRALSISAPHRTC